MKTLLKIKPSFIISTGRTGTTFLHDVIRRFCPDADCFQEPSPSWRFQIFSNLHAEGVLGQKAMKWIARHFIASRSTLASKTHKRYIEINPFLFGLIAPLHEILGNIKVLHLIRHPFNFIASTIYFRPAGWRAKFINAPLWNLNASRALRQSSSDWKDLSNIEQKAWQWVYVNQTIASYEDLGLKYQWIRFEEMVSDDAFIRKQTLTKVFDFLKLGETPQVPPEFYENKANSSSACSRHEWENWSPDLQESVLKICGPLMKKFGYAGNPAVFQ